MCVAALPALAAAGSLVSAGGTLYAGVAQKRAADFNSQVSAMNSKIAADKAADVYERGQEEEQKQRRATARLMGQQTAAFGANNVDLGFGSPLDTLVDTATMGELDALTIRRNTEREAFDTRLASTNLKNQGRIQKMEGKSALVGSVLSAGGSLLTGGSKGVAAARGL